MIKTYEKFNLKDIFPKTEEYEILSFGIYKFCKKVNTNITKEKSDDSGIPKIEIYFNNKDYKYKNGLIGITRYHHLIEISFHLYQDIIELKKIFKYFNFTADRLGLQCDNATMFGSRFIKMKYEEVDKFLNSLSLDEFEMFDEIQKYNL